MFDLNDIDYEAHINSLCDENRGILPRSLEYIY